MERKKEEKRQRKRGEKVKRYRDEGREERRTVEEE